LSVRGTLMLAADSAQQLAGDIEFYELAYLDVTLERRGSEAQVVLKNFIIPNEDLVPDEVRAKIKRWSDYVDFWGVDWDFQGDTFHNQWQSYRTRQHPALQLESDWHTLRPFDLAQGRPFGEPNHVKLHCQYCHKQEPSSIDGMALYSLR